MWSVDDGLKNLIFTSDDQELNLVPDFIFDVNDQDLRSSIRIPQGYNMIGVNSLDAEKDGRRYISAIEFLFIDTSDLRC